MCAWIFVYGDMCVLGSIRCQFRCYPRPSGETAGLGTRMRSESVRKGGSKSRSACCRYTVYLKESSMVHEAAKLGVSFLIENNIPTVCYNDILCFSSTNQFCGKT